jgi:hypothetical protein
VPIKTNLRSIELWQTNRCPALSSFEGLRTPHQVEKQVDIRGVQGVFLHADEGDELVARYQYSEDQIPDFVTRGRYGARDVFSRFFW